MVAVTNLRGVGPGIADKLQRLGIHTLPDLLFHLPTRYQDRTRVQAIGGLRQGMEAVIEGEVIHAEVVQRRRRMLLVNLRDGSGSLLLRFFHFTGSQQQQFARGTRVRCFGEVRQGHAALEMVHPEQVPSVWPGMAGTRLTPIYPTTEGVHQITLRKTIQQALDWLEHHPETLVEWLPAEFVSQGEFADLKIALQYLHHPPAEADTEALTNGRHPAQRRLAFEELLAQQLSLVRLRARAEQQAAPAIRVPGKLFARLRAGLPFGLTGAQMRVIEELRADMAKPYPMLRLVQGDVGSGKTLIAAAACLQVVEAGLQAAIMAPTEILAEQHYRSFCTWLEPMGLEPAWLSGKAGARERGAMQTAIAAGEAQVTIGTHALFQAGIDFKALALVVVDEQHRFGVHQRLALREKGATDDGQPHQLVLTATPIPRTLAMTAYADLDYSVIDELPPGRPPVTTIALANSRRAEVVERVSSACASGRQAYWVCTLIEESEALQCQAAEDAHAQLAEALPHLRIDLIHGRLKSEDKQRVMARFANHECDLLVATTVIEVGLDVPNASLMIIENAERLGLAQLHQLRGRVGRGDVASNCVLMYQTPLSANARQRLNAMRNTQDGFEIARADLEIRGPGEVLGTRQTGILQLRIADLIRDADLLPSVNKAAQQIMQAYPQNVEPLIERWLGDSMEFGRV